MRVREERTDFKYFKILLESPFYQEKIIADSGRVNNKAYLCYPIDKMLIALPSDKKEQLKILKILKRKKD